MVHLFIFYWPPSLSWFSHRGCRLWTLLGALPRRAAPVEFHQPLDGFDAQCLPVRPHCVGVLLLPQLSSQPHHLQPALHTLQGVLQRTGVLPVWGQELWERLTTIPQDLQLQLQSSCAGEGLQRFHPVALSECGSECTRCHPNCY